MTAQEKKSANWTLLFAIALAVLLLLLWLKGCEGSAPAIVKVKTPEVKGSFEAVKPKNEPILNHIVDVNKKVNGQKLSKENEFLQAEIDRLLKEYNSLDEAFAKANDSLQQEIYKRTIAPKLFSKFFDNDTLSATVKGIVANGEVQKLKLDYTIKSRNIYVKIPEVKFRLLGGVEAGMTKDLTKFNAKVNLGFQNPKGNILNLSADSDQRFYIGYATTIFSIKK